MHCRLTFAICGKNSIASSIDRSRQSIVLAGLICLFALIPADTNADQPPVSPESRDQTATPSNSEAPDSQRLLTIGARIYKQACQNCHGQAGQGNPDHYEEPLIGDLSVGSLTELISKTMPEDKADSCVGAEAAAVAAYIHATFYGEAARVRNRPPKIKLSRLTGDQLRQSLADLYGHFTRPPSTSDQRGVAATYYNGTSRKQDQLRIDRIDDVIDFDFGKESPGKEIDPKSFLIQWQGSLKVNRTGTYQIVLRSSCSCMMEFGSNDRDLINNHVQSEGRDEFRRDLRLTAGRAYPFEISFLQRKRKTDQPAAKISLSWIPPGGIEEVIPKQHLIPEKLADTFTLQTKLPPDDRSYGYDRGTSVSRQWDQSTTAAAIEFAETAIGELYPNFVRRHKNDPHEDRALLRRFLGELVEVAFRGHLQDAARDLYIDQQIELTEDDGDAIRRVLLLALKSPRFLYPTLDSQHNRSQRAANRLTLILFDSLPSDSWLINAAKKNQLQTEKQLANAARRMVNDYRCQAKTLAFIEEWLEIRNTEEITKDQETFPGFNAILVQDLRKSMDRFLEELLASETSDFRQLLQSDWCYTTQRLENYYGEAWSPEPPGADDAGADDADPGPTRKTESELVASIHDPNIHGGVLTHPLIMSHLAYHRNTSPIHRGVFLTRRTLGRVLRPPETSFTPLSPDLHPELTTRERVQLQTGEVNCQRCHQQINSIGFAYEQFDATGRFRTTDRNKPIDTTGGYTERSGNRISFSGARELADYLAQSDDCHHAFVESAFEHFVKQPIVAYGPETANQLTTAFRDNHFNIRELLVNIALTASRQPVPDAVVPSSQAN